MPQAADVMRVALTGAAGSLAGDVIPGLLDLGYHLVCLDRRRPDRPRGGTWYTFPLEDRDALSQALNGCDAVVHLAGIPLEADWDAVLSANVGATQAVLETSRSLGIGKVVLASSIHAAGFVPVPPPGEKVPDDVPVRPNTFYGVSKAAVEALGSMYHDRHGMDVVCLRIASRFDRPRDERMLSTWLSPADAVRLLHAALSPSVKGFRLVWGVSANTRSYLSPEGGSAIGFEPADNAERWAGELVSDQPPQLPDITDWNARYIGGAFCSPRACLLKAALSV
ncbi:NAD-dependent epimerase/dehydratase family protein [Georgenia sp. AZ-5]|uniref:NAD-dependent epimerase/dehydratase family protein n=1 Tax=Georgenia sp. AZ-5 TaxID=3367526 RepID=UPI00375469CB